LRLTGDATQYDHRDGNDDYTRAGNLFRLMNPEQRERLCESIARHMETGNTPQEIQLRQIRRFFRADPAYGISVAQALGIDLTELMPNGAVQLEAVAEK
jgi:catalase